MTKIAIFSADDRIWFLPGWDSVLERLAGRYEIVGIYLFPGNNKITRYFKTFSWLDCFLLGLFSLRKRCGQPSWESLAKKYGLTIRKGRDPNAPEVVSWIRERQVDVLWISLEQILKGEVLKAPRIGILNKHASILPMARGLLPFFWCVLKGFPQGVTFHAVNQRVDGGPVISQWRYLGGRSSLVRFYSDLYAGIAGMMEKSMQRWLLGELPRAPSDLPAAYFGWPEAKDVREFKNRGGRIVRWADLFYSPAPRFEEILS